MIEWHRGKHPEILFLTSSGVMNLTFGGVSMF